jgi:hypothetical protein
MLTTNSHPGRPLAGALATGVAAGAYASLLFGELAHPLIATRTAAAVGLIAFFLLGTLFSRRLLPGREPAAVLVPLLGLLGAALPVSLLALRLGLHFLGPWAGELGLAPAGLAAGLVCATCLAAGRAHPRWSGRPAALPLLMVGAAICGLAFARVVSTRLSTLNFALDLTMACAAMGIVCAAGTSTGRRHETWLSLLAVAAILILPLSSIVDQRTQPWLAETSQVASHQNAPATPGTPAP